MRLQALLGSYFCADPKQPPELFHKFLPLLRHHLIRGRLPTNSLQVVPGNTHNAVLSDRSRGVNVPLLDSLKFHKCRHEVSPLL